MAFANAQQSRLLYGTLHLSGLTKQATFGHAIDQLEVTTLADAAKVFIPGMEQSTVSADMFLDDNGSVAQLAAFGNTWKATADFPFTLAPYGLTAGNTAVLVNVLEASASVSSAVAGTADLSFAGTTDGATDYGTVLEPLAALTGTTTGTARDGTAGTTNGGVAHLHVTAYATLTSDTVTIEHSVDGATAWATLVTFATVTGVTSERVVVAAGTTVRRYLRVVDTIVGSGSVTRTVSFARR